MASFARQVLGELLTVLRSDWGDFDLSSSGSTHRVVVGQAMEPPVNAPFVYLGMPSKLDASYGGHASIGEYQQDGEIFVRGFVPADTLDVSERALDALDFQEELERKLTVAHKTPANTTLYSLLALLIEWDEPMGDAFELPDGNVIVEGRIKYTRVTVGGF